MYYLCSHNLIEVYFLALDHVASHAFISTPAGENLEGWQKCLEICKLSFISH